MRELLAPFGGEVRTFDEPAAAEFVKCAHNIYNATKISFWNEMWLVAQSLGIDADPVASTVAASSEGSINPLLRHPRRRALRRRLPAQGHQRLPRLRRGRSASTCRCCGRSSP